MKKILVISRVISGSSLAKKLAEENEDILIDLIGPVFKGKLPLNLNQIGECYTSEEAYDWLLKIYKEYDFICAYDHLFQNNEKYHSWKKNIDIPILSPGPGVYNLEYSKIYTKSICKELKIPTPRYKIFYENDLRNFYEFYNSADKCVFKIDQTSMSFGWQTRIIEKGEDITSILKHYKGWADNIFVEEYIEGKDVSFHVLTNGKSCVYLGSAKDYKRIYDNDKGINCGSAGSYSSVDYLDDVNKDIILDYAEKIVSYLNNIGIDYKGILYLGIKICTTSGIPYLLEINTRSGNPEFNVILPTIESKNLLKNLVSAAAGNELETFSYNNKSAMAITLLNKNYSPTEKNEEIPNLPITESIEYYFYNSKAFLNNYHASLVTVSDSKNQCKDILEKYLSDIDLKNFRYRSDIGS